MKYKRKLKKQFRKGKHMFLGNKPSARRKDDDKIMMKYFEAVTNNMIFDYDHSYMNLCFFNNLEPYGKILVDKITYRNPPL